MSVEQIIFILNLMVKNKNKIALVFGCTGQDGSYLTELLLKKGYFVHGVVRRASTFNTSRLNHLYQDPHERNKRLFLHHGDLADSGTIRKIIYQVKPDEIYNLGAQSVTGECLCPILSAQKLEYRTLEDLWSEQVKKRGKVRVEKMDDTNVEVIDLSNNTQLRALGMWNGMGTFFPIKQISRHRWSGKVAKLSQKFGSVTVTPNHSVIDVTGKICRPSENPWLLNIRKLNYKPNRYRKSISLKLDGVYKFDNKYFWLDEHGLISKVLRKVKGDTLKSFCRFTGAFIAEGHTSFNKANKNWYVGISSNNKEWLKSLESDLKKFYVGSCWYVKHKKDNYKDVWELQIKSRALYNLLRKLLGENSKTKQLPYWFSQIEAKFLEEIWEKMCEGDGCINPGTGFRYTTNSYKLACQLSLLFTLLNYDYTVNEENNKNTGYHSVWHFRECTTYQPNQGNSKKLEWIDYNGWVYDITVAEVHNFAVGVGNIVVHNSHVKVSFEIPEYTMDITGNGALRVLEAIRDFQEDMGQRYAKGSGLASKKVKFYQASSSEMFGSSPPPQNEKTPFNPQSPYGAAKLFAYNMTNLYREAYGIFAVNGILFNHECITAQTPVIIRRGGLIDILPIEEIVPHREDPTKGKKYITMGNGGVEIWDGDKWSKIKTLTATWNEYGSSKDKKIKRVICRGGYYEATEDHISFLKGATEIKTGNLKPGDNLELKTLPPLQRITITTLEEAELLGMLVADGYISSDGKGRFINNTDNLRRRFADLWQKVSGGSSREDDHPSGFNPANKIKSTELRGNADYLRFIWKEIYTQKLFKRVPKRILNSNHEVVLAFLSGYNSCDGLRGGHQKTEFKSFTTNSSVLAASLWYLVKNTLELRMTLHPEFRKNYLYYHLNINSNQKTGKGKHLQRELTEIKLIKNHGYTGWLFDLETESNTFSAGIGLTWIHNSPRRGETFVTRKITRGIARIKAGLDKKLYLGNLDARRDWGYAPEFCEAMWLMMQQPKPDDYVIGTGETHTVREFVQLAFQEAGLGDYKKYVEIDPRYYRPAEVHHLIADSSKAKKMLGWQPKTKFKDLVKIMVWADINEKK